MPNVIRICVGICALALSFTAGAAVTAAVMPAEDPVANAATPACGSGCSALYAAQPGAADGVGQDLRTHALSLVGGTFSPAQMWQEISGVR